MGIIKPTLLFFDELKITWDHPSQSINPNKRYAFIVRIDNKSNEQSNNNKWAVCFRAPILDTLAVVHKR